MKTKIQMRSFKILSILVVASVLVTGLSLFPTQPVSASGIVGTITHPGFLPTALALDETRNRLFVFDQATQKVFVYDATTLQELGNIATTLEASVSMVIDESAGKLYVGYSGSGLDVPDGIAVINTATAAFIKYLPSGGFTYLVKDEALNVVYASSNFYGVRKIDVASDGPTPVSGITANLYTSMAVNPVTHELFVSNWSQNNGNFFVVNPTNLQKTTIPNMNGFGVAVNSIENKVYVSYCQPAGSEAVCILDRDTNTRNDLHTTNDSTEPMAFNPSVNRMYTNTEVNRIATIFNGSTDAYTNIELTGGLATVGVRNSTDNVYYVDAAGTYVMNGSTGKIVAEFPAGGSCSVCQGAIVINQTSGLVYVINDDSVGKVTVIQDGTFALSCTVTPLSGAGTVSAALTSSDCHSPLQNEQSYWNPYFADRYSINLTAGQRVSVLVDGNDASEVIYLLHPSGNVLAQAAGDYFSPARLPSSGAFTVPVSGTYTIEVTSVWSGLENGSFADSEWPYTLTLAIVSNGDTTGVFRPVNGILFLKNKNDTGFADIAINYGIPGDYPVVGDWDGNGTATIGVYRNGMFLLRNSNTVGFADLAFAFGQPGDQPIAGDWNGDGVDTIGVYRPSIGQFLLRNSNDFGPAEMSFYLGNVGDVGIAGDWNGDGKDTTGVFRPSNGVLFLKNTNETGFAELALNYGIPGDKPVTGDWDGDGIDTIGVYRLGQFMLRNENTNGFADIVFGLGIPGDMPIAGDWDGLP